MSNRASITGTSPAPSQNLPPPSPAAGRILVVDDDEDLRNILAEVLRMTGYDVRCVEDGEAGWTALSEKKYDLLITDHEMPRLTGGDLLRRVRGANHRMPVILVSGKLVWPDAELLHVLPPGVAMEKPFSWTELLTNVRGLLAPNSSPGAPHGAPTAPLVEPRNPRAIGRVRRHQAVAPSHP